MYSCNKWYQICVVLFSLNMNELCHSGVTLLWEVSVLQQEGMVSLHSGLSSSFFKSRFCIMGLCYHLMGETIKYVR